MLKRILTHLLLAAMVSAAHAAGPSVQLHDLEGKPRNASEFIGHGKWVVVVVWAHDCRVCAEEIDEMNALHKARSDRDVSVLGVSIDGRTKLEAARAFVSRHNLPFTNLVAEPEKELMMRFGGGPFIGTPTYYFYHPSGKIVSRNVGPTSRKDVEKFIDGYSEGS